MTAKETESGVVALPMAPLSPTARFNRPTARRSSASTAG